MADLGRNGDRTEFKYVGKWGIPSPVTYPLITGAAKYPLEVVYPGMLYGDFIKSPYARARIKSMDVSTVQAMPGVKAVITWDDEELQNMAPGLINQKCPVLCNEAGFEGCEVGAAVVAETPEMLEEALKVLGDSIEWEVLPHILDVQESVKPEADKLHPAITPDNNIGATEGWEKGDIEAAFADADNVIDFELTYQGIAFDKVKPRHVVSRWEQEPYSDQGPTLFMDGHYFRSSGNAPLRTAFNLAENKVRTSIYADGSFFCDHSGMTANIVGPILAKRTGKPVAMVQNRRGSFSWLGAGAYAQMKVAFDDEGVMTAVHLKAIGDFGSIGYYGNPRLGDALKTLKCPNVKYESKIVYTNKPKTVGDRGIPYRATPLAAAIWRIADQLDMDPTEVALKNCHSPEPSLKSVIEAGKEAVNWQWHAAGAKTLPNGKKHGYGFRYNPGQNFGLATFRCGLVLKSDGKIYMPNEEGLRGNFSPDSAALIIAEETGSKADNVIVHYGYNLLPFALCFYGGFSANSLWVAKEAAALLRDKILAAAAPKLGVTVDELDTANSEVFVKADPAKKIAFGALAPLWASYAGTSPNKSDPTYAELTALNAIFCEVEVDEETGEVEITNMVGAHDCGKIIRASSYYGQLEGNMIWNIGYGKMEEVIYDKGTGVMLNGNAYEYKLPTILDTVPAAKGVGVENRLGGGPYGASAGLAHQIISRNIVCLAVQNAIGKWIDPPVTPNKVLKALGKA